MEVNFIMNELEVKSGLSVVVIAYVGEEDHSFSIRSSSESKMACTKWGMSRCRLARTLVTSEIDYVALLEAALHS
ncbi:hypothetical protein Tco_1182789 [Tanacetum coccineum]